MLKKICKLFLGLVVCTSSACVTPTHASSAPSVIITNIQAGGVSSAKEEVVVIYNSTSSDIDITNWCIANKANTLFACFESDNEEGKILSYTLPAFSYASVVSAEYAARAQVPDENYSLIYASASSSSGSITGSADSITLINTSNEAVDTKAWGTSLTGGKSFGRFLLMTNPDTFAVTGAAADWVVNSKLDIPSNAVTTTEVIQDIGEPPINPEEDASDPLSPPDTLLVPIITEVYPNPPGADTGAEFIELFNPSNEAALTLQDIHLRVGTDSPKWYTFPNDTLQPGEYKAYYNSLINFTLVNTAGRIQLFQHTKEIGEPIEYTSPKEGQSWALIENIWQYAHPSPNIMNATLQHMTPGDTEALNKENTSTQKPCAANQYRNPETGRCKLIAAAASTPTPCKVGQERNPETNRCRNITAAVKGVTACKEGQERNPETNRCRNIVKMTKVGHGIEVSQGADNQPSWYYWLTLGALVTAILGYAIWEWREELSGVWARARSLLTK